MVGFTAKDRCMDHTSSKRILLVGATGYAGCKLASYLLTGTDAIVILSGRSRAKLEQLRSGLQTHGLENRLELLELDAADLDVAAVPEFDLLVNATANGPHNASLIHVCLERRADWIDMQMTNELLEPSTALQNRIKRAGCRFVIQAGFHPGVIAALVRYGAQQMDVMDSAIVGSVIRDKTGLPFTSGVSELVESFRDYKSEMYKGGRWQKLKYGDYPKIEFDSGFGRQLTFPVEMPELRRLPELLPGLKNTGFFVAGFNWFADYLVAPLMMLGSGVASRQTATTLGRLLSWSTKKFAKPPYGTVVQVDAEGQSEGQPVRFRLSLFDEDAYVLTAVPTVAMIKQMLQEELQPGIHLMGLCCDPVELLANIERMGIPIIRELETIR
jgi:saccharopine dehydrogenase-like NADP-dependent oxidoreductase